MLEPQTVRGEILNGIFWALYTVTTVGYSDVTPATMWGRLIGVILMVTSVGLISTLAASITASFLGQEEGLEIKELRKQSERLEALLLEVLNREQNVPGPSSKQVAGGRSGYDATPPTRMDNFPNFPR